MKCCINDVNFIRLLLLSAELFKFEIQKYGQILCVHKPYFLMPGHKFSFAKSAIIKIANFSVLLLRVTQLKVLLYVTGLYKSRL